MGIALVGNEACITDVSRTRVRFRKLTEKDIQSYALFIDKIEGDYRGMVGLPIVLIERHLHARGIDLLSFAR